jgi:glutamate formiminotransferase
MTTALFGLVRQAQSLMDIRQHEGEHPRIGVVDVVPWIPFQGVTMEDCVTYANDLGARVGKELEIPVFLYEQAGVVPSRTRLEIIRRGGLSALETRMKTDRQWKPDYGPPGLDPSAGAIAIGARFFLIAFNVVLKSDDLVAAGHIAQAVRTSSGGLPSVKAMGVPLAFRKCVQVSMNLMDYRETSLRMAFEAVKREAQRYDVGILESEIVGLVPQGAWDDTLVNDLKLRPMESDPILEFRLEHSSGFQIQSKSSSN